MIRISELTFDAWGRRFFDNASVALPLTDNGLKSRPVPSVSLDYAFGR